MKGRKKNETPGREKKRPGSPNWETKKKEKPCELKHLSSKRKRNQERYPE